MTSLEHDLKRSIASHNRQCWLGALTSLFCAWLAWAFAYGVFAGFLMLVETVRVGENAEFPQWIHPAFAAFAVAILIVAGIDTWRNRYRPPADRPVIGWHLLPDILLLPARLIFSIGAHLDVRLHLNRHQRTQAAHLLTVIFEKQRAPVSELGYDFPDARELQRLLSALQLLQWIDLHRNDEEWFYKVRGDQEERLTQLLE